MDYGLVFWVSSAWVGGLVGGGFITLGLIEAISGRAVVNIQRINWSSNEATLLGFVRTIQGLSIAAYPLMGALALGVHAIPAFWVGHAWGILVAAPFMLVILATVAFQAVLEVRHQHRSLGSGVR